MRYQQPRQQFPFKDYDWQNRILLGKGSFGEVYKTRKFSNGQYVAIKSINMQLITSQQMMDSLERQIIIQQQTAGPHVVRLYEYNISNGHSYIIMQICEGDLYNYLKNSKYLVSVNECTQIMRQIIEGFLTLIQRSYIHRDIKPDNILVKNKQYKIADFGFAIRADVSCMRTLNEFCGTPIYMAPQILMQQPYTAKCDIWSLGIMFYQMIFGYVPWPDTSIDGYIQAIRTTKLTFPYDSNLNTNVKDFIKRCLVVNQQMRMNWEELFNHPLVKSNSLGNPSEAININQMTRRVLQKLQLQIRRMRIDQFQVYKRFEQYGHLNFQKFQIFLRQLSPTITYNESMILFQYFDANRNGIIDQEQFYNLFCSIDFRQQDDIKSRYIERIARTIQSRGIDINQIFNQFDTNKSGQLDWNQFNILLSQIFNNLTAKQAERIYKYIDKDLSGLISKQQFISSLQQYMYQPMPKNRQVQSLRGERNLNNITNYFSYQQITAEQFLNFSDINRDRNVEIYEFIQLLKKFNYNISQQQMVEVFQLIDKNHNGVLDINELKMILW